ncbi:hypothetical protein [Parasphingorhabdus sp.]|uniref:hypothetical protein n=1 Tax=Parasphingorhabdus sp. TaxID=2709688 RepID=UPI003264CE3F
MVALPAFAGWSLSQKYDQPIRMICTILLGQMILTPGMLLITLSDNQAMTENPTKTVMVYAAMALMISIMTFVILEIRKTRLGK